MACTPAEFRIIRFKEIWILAWGVHPVEEIEAHKLPHRIHLNL